MGFGLSVKAVTSEANADFLSSIAPDFEAVGEPAEVRSPDSDTAIMASFHKPMRRHSKDDLSICSTAQQPAWLRHREWG